MAKPTLLDIVQEILNDMSGDFVNSIDDSEEAQQVANIVRSTYRAMLSNRNWPHTKKIVNLVPYTDNTLPTHMKLDRDFKRLISIFYDCRKVGEDAPLYKEMKWKEPDDFLRYVFNRNAKDNPHVMVVTDPSGARLSILTNKAPEFYTSFDDTTLVFDSFDNTVDSTIQASKMLARAYIMPELALSDTAIPDLPEEAFTALIEEAKSRASAKLEQEADVKSEQESRRQQRWLSRQAWKTHGGIKYPNYGRKKGRYKDPTFRND